MTYQPKTEMFDHQREWWEKTRHLREWALFWEQGTGKSKETVDTAGWQYAEGMIDAVLVLAPGGVHRNWITDELPKHMPDYIEWRGLAWNSDKAETKWHQKAVADVVNFKGLAVLSLTYDTMRTARGKKAVWDFLRKRRALMICDESHRIKTPSAKRTITVLAAGRYAHYRRILTGTPVSNSPFDVYSQIKFLDPEYWIKTMRIGSFSAFKAEFGRFVRVALANGNQFDQLIEYRNLDMLNEVLSYISCRVLKDDVLDLPPKLYSPRYVEMTPSQAQMYEQLKREFLTWLVNEQTGESGLVAATMAITRLLRLQQITCGYVPTDEDSTPKLLPGPNPRLDALLGILEDHPEKMIVWARFTKDIDLIMELSRQAGRKPVRYDGTMSDDALHASKVAFQDGDADLFVGNPAKGSEGLTLTAARTCVYYNNSFKLIDREQSEDRLHRIGQENPVLYIDLICPGTIDEHIVKALKMKKDIASQVTGDEMKEWLS